MEQDIRRELLDLNLQAKDLLAIYHRAAATRGVTDNELWVWYTLLLLEGTYTQQDICEMWSLPKQTVHSLVSNMVKRGYVELEPVPGSRNRKRIRLTEAGRAYGTEIVAPVYQAEQRAMGQLTEQERQTFSALLDKYISLLGGELV